MSFFIFIVVTGLELNCLINALLTGNWRWLIPFCVIHGVKSFVQILWNGQVELRIDRLYRMFGYHPLQSEEAPQDKDDVHV